jgi:hypothetical protein
MDEMTSFSVGILVGITNSAIIRSDFNLIYAPIYGILLFFTKRYLSINMNAMRIFIRMNMNRSAALNAPIGIYDALIQKSRLLEKLDWIFFLYISGNAVLYICIRISTLWIQLGYFAIDFSATITFLLAFRCKTIPVVQIGIPVREKLKENPPTDNVAISLNGHLELGSPHNRL